MVNVALSLQIVGEQQGEVRVVFDYENARCVGVTTGLSSPFIHFAGLAVASVS
jgi:hypothetical protein